MDAAETAGLDNSAYSCRAGACSTCCARLLRGKVHVPEDTFMDEDQRLAGYFAYCVAHASSDCDILLNQEDHLY